MNVTTPAQSDSADRTAIDRLPVCGIWSPAITPLKADLGIDVERYVAHARWLLDNGCHGVALFGTTGEANSFSVEEREALLEAVVEAGLPTARLMVGTGCCALTDSVRLTAHAARLGCKQVLMLPPFYYKPMSDEGLARSYSEVIERVADPELKVVLYHFPALSGVPITFGLIERLLAAHAGTVVGVKDSSGDWENTAALRSRFPGLAVFPGSERFLLTGLEAGSAGCITACANAYPGAIRAVYDAWRGGEDDVSERQARITAWRSRMETQAMIPGLKYLAGRAREDRAWRRVRPPLLALDDAAGEALAGALAASGFSP